MIDGARHDNASKKQIDLRNKICIRSTALYAFHTAEPFYND